MKMTDFLYEGVRRVVYGEGATFIPVCPKCRRFVKADARRIFKGEDIAHTPDATCVKCGRVEMPFEGFM